MRVRLLGEEFRRRYHWDAYANVGGKFYFSRFASLFFKFKIKALVFIHGLNIAHRVSTWLYQLIFLAKNFQLPLRCFQDAFHDNFIVQWHPESLFTMKISFTRPRVYLIDFEVAIQFPAEFPESECVSVGPPSWLLLHGGGALCSPSCTWVRLWSGL